MDSLFEIVGYILSAFPILYVLCGAIGIWLFLGIIALIDYGLVLCTGTGLSHKKAGGPDRSLVRKLRSTGQAGAIIPRHRLQGAVLQRRNVATIFTRDR